MRPEMLSLLASILRHPAVGPARCLFLTLFLAIPCLGKQHLLNITSNPPGARVEIDGEYAGETPLSVNPRCGGSCLNGPGWTWSKHLSSPITMTVSKRGCTPQTLSLTDGPYEATNLLGMHMAEYYTLKAEAFEVNLVCSEEAYYVNSVTFSNETRTPVAVLLLGPSAKGIDLVSRQQVTVYIAPGDYEVVVGYGAVISRHVAAMRYSKNSLSVMQTEMQHTAAKINLHFPDETDLDAKRIFEDGSITPQARTSVVYGNLSVERGDLTNALKEYQNARDVNYSDTCSSLIDYRIGQVLFLQQEYASASDWYSNALSCDGEPRWTVAWSHIQLGKIFDLSGKRTRAIKEYEKAVETDDDTANAQEEVQEYLRVPFHRSDPSHPSP